MDHAVWENHSRPSGLPLILCAVHKNFERFARLSKNPFLVDKGIASNPESLSIDRLHEQAWQIIAPYYRQQVDNILNEFGRASAHQQGSGDIAQVAEAATQSRVGTLLVDADKHVGGKIDTSGGVEFGDLSRGEFDDVLDDIAERVIKTGGQVLVMPHSQMPTATGVAAIYRF